MQGKHPTKKVKFEEFLAYNTMWNILSVADLVEHMECHGGRKYGGCLGQLLFDMIAGKVLNPLIPLPGVQFDNTIE